MRCRVAIDIICDQKGMPSRIWIQFLVNHQSTVTYMKSIRSLLILTFCLTWLNANPVVSVDNETVEKMLLEQIDESRLAYQLYTELFEIHPEITIFKKIIATEKKHFSELEDYIQKAYPTTPIGRIKGKFLENENRQLHNKLLTKGRVSAKNAAQVCIDLEEVRLETIADFISLETSLELENMFKELKRESKENLSAFKRQKTRS